MTTGQGTVVRRAPERQRARQERILQVAMEHFARRGYEDARAEEIAAQAGVSKGAVFGYFDTKAGLFLAAYQAAARSFPAYLDAPAEVCGAGFFAVLRYWIGAHPAPHPRGLDPLPGHADRQLLRRAPAAPRDHPVPGARGPVRDAGVRPVRHRPR